jgi:hypothetical protein
VGVYILLVSSWQDVADGNEIVFLIAVNVMIVLFWDVTPCRAVEKPRRVKNNVSGSIETSVGVYDIRTYHTQIYCILAEDYMRKYQR